MNRASSQSAPVVVAAFLAATASAGGIEIRHDPIPCVTAGRYTRVSASSLPMDQVAMAELQFRERAAGGWYSVRMAAEGGAWSGVLPRPVPPLSQFEYRIVMTAADLAAAETPTFSVPVADEPAGCASGRPPIDVATGQLTITVAGVIAHGQTLELPFTFID